MGRARATTAGSRATRVSAFLLVAAVAATPAAFARSADEERLALARGAVAASTRLLQRSAQVWSMTQGCASCHHQMLGTIAVRLVEERGLPAAPDMREVQVAALRGRLQEKRIQHLFGLASANPAIAESYALWALAAAGHPAGPDTDAAIHALALRQGADGRWPSLGHQPPLEDSAVTATALTVRALAAYGPPGLRTDLARRVARAREWLARVAPRDAEERTMQILGLFWAGEEPSALEPLLAELRSLQRPDGGWSQLPTRASDAYATGQALVVLHAVGAESVEGEVYRRGVDFLLASFADGSWHVRTRAEPRYPRHPETGYPHGVDQFSSYAGSCWATMALAFAVAPGPSAVLRVGAAPRGDGAADDLPPAVAVALFGGLDELRAVLDEDPEALDRRGPLGLSPLLAAAPDPEKTALLLERGAQADQESELGLRPLHVAAWSAGAQRSVELLLRAGASPRAATPTGLDAAYLAAISGRVESLQLLVATIGRVRWPADAPHPLLVAVERLDAAAVASLLARGIAPDEPRSEQGQTALQIAVRHRAEELVALLLRAGADPTIGDVEGRTALHWAALSDAGHPRVVELLLEAGADATLRSRSGERPADIARASGNVEVAALLAALAP